MKLKAILKQKKISQTELRKLTGLSKNAISETVSGKRWRLEELEIIAKVLRVTVEEISAAEEEVDTL